MKLYVLISISAFLILSSAFVKNVKAKPHGADCVKTVSFDLPPKAEESDDTVQAKRSVASNNDEANAAAKALASDNQKAAHEKAEGVDEADTVGAEGQPNLEEEAEKPTASGVFVPPPAPGMVARPPTPDMLEADTDAANLEADSPPAGNLGKLSSPVAAPAIQSNPSAQFFEDLIGSALHNIENGLYTRLTDRGKRNIADLKGLLASAPQVSVDQNNGGKRKAKFESDKEADQSCLESDTEAEADDSDVPQVSVTFELTDGNDAKSGHPVDKETHFESEEDNVFDTHPSRSNGIAQETNFESEGDDIDMHPSKLYAPAQDFQFESEGNDDFGMHPSEFNIPAHTETKKKRSVPNLKAPPKHIEHGVKAAHNPSSKNAASGAKAASHDASKNLKVQQEAEDKTHKVKPEGKSDKKRLAGTAKRAAGKYHASKSTKEKSLAVTAKISVGQSQAGQSGKIKPVASKKSLGKYHANQGKSSLLRRKKRSTKRNKKSGRKMGKSKQSKWNKRNNRRKKKANRTRNQTRRWKKKHNGYGRKKTRKQNNY